MLPLPLEIRQALHAHRRKIVRARAVRGLALTSSVGLIVFAASLLADRLLLLPTAARVTLTGITMAVTAILFCWTLLRVLLTPDELGLAWELEAREPRLGESLASLVQISRLPGAERERFSKVLLAGLVRFAGARLPPSEKADSKEGHGMAWLLAGSIAAWSVLGSLVFTDACSLRQLAARFLHPAADLPRPSTVALEVSPGNAAVASGDNVEITAAVLRGTPRSAVLLWQREGREWSEETLQPQEPALFRKRFSAVRQPLEYRVIAGDFTSPTFRIAPREPPAPTSFRITYSFPEPTGRQPETVERSGGDLEAVEGTRVQLEIVASEPLERARLEEFPSRPDSPEDSAVIPSRVELAVDGQRATGPELLLSASGEYRLHLEGVDGVTNLSRDRYTLRVLVDAPPRVEMLEPRAPEVIVESSGFLEIRYRAEDDLGLRSVELVVLPADRGTAEAQRIPLWSPETSGSREEVGGSHLLDVRGLDLAEGESTVLRIRASDGPGQEAISEPRTVLLAPSLHPPEGPGWPAPLKRITREIALALRDWRRLLPGSTEDGDDTSEEGLVVDAARLEQLEVLGEKALSVRSLLHATGRYATEAGRAIAIPSPQRARLEQLGRFLRRTAEEECSTFWHESARITEELRESLRHDSRGDAEGAPRPPRRKIHVPALREAHARASGRITAALSAARALHESERFEELFERALAISWDAVTLLYALPSPNGTTPDGRTVTGPKDAPAVQARARDLLREGTLLAATLNSVDGSGYPEELAGEKPSSPNLRPLARGILESVVPDLDALRTIHEEVEPKIGPTADPALEETRTLAGRVASSLRIFSRRLEDYHRKQEEAANATIGLVVEPGRIEELLGKLILLAGENPDDPSRGGNSRSLLLERSLALSLAEELDEVESREYRDLRSGLELSSILEIVQASARTRTRESAAGSPAPLLHKVLEAYRDTAPSRRIGAVLAALHRAAGGEEELHWKLRTSGVAGFRSRRVLSRVQLEISRLVATSIDELSELRASADSGDELRRGLEAITADLEDAGSVLNQAHRTLAKPGNSVLRCAPADPCEDRRPLGAEELAAVGSESARTAGELDEAVQALERLRETALPAAAAAAAWLREALGTLPERVFQLAGTQRELAVELGKLAGAPGDDSLHNRPFEEIPALLLRQEELRSEAELLAVRIRREGDGILESSASAERVRMYDQVAAGLLTVRSAEMLAVSRGLREGRSADPDEIPGVLLAASVQGEEAARLLERLAGVLEAAGSEELIESARREMDELLRRLESPGVAESSGPGEPTDREIAKAHEDLAKLLGLEELQEEVARLFQDLLGQPELDAEGVEKLKLLEEKVEEELRDNFVTLGELVELVTRLVLLEREAGRIAGLERSLAAAVRSPAGEREGLAGEHAQLTDRARGMVREFFDSGFKLSSILPVLFRAFARAQGATEELVSSMEEAGSRLTSAGKSEAESESVALSTTESLLAAAAHLDEFGAHLQDMRRAALEALADQERGEGGPNSALLGLEAARRNVDEALRLIRGGDIESASRVHQAGMRSIADSRASLRAHMKALVQPGGNEGTLMSRVLDEEARRLGLAWQVVTRGEDPGSSLDRYLRGSDEMAYPARFRDLVRVYLLAIGGRE